MPTIITTCTKRWSDIPFAHRQHTHKGHCRFIHGHNWAIELEFGATVLDENGFVIDFGGLGQIKQWIEDNLDHALVLSEKDPLISALPVLVRRGEYSKPFIIPDCSCEGLAKHLGEIFGGMVCRMTNARAGVIRCTIFEDSKNSATCSLGLIDPDSVVEAITRRRLVIQNLLEDQGLKE